MSKASVPLVAAEADAFIMNVRQLPLYRYGFSFNKLFDYMAAGRPIVFAGPVDSNPLAEAAGGLLTAADDSVGMAYALESLERLSLEERRALGRSARQYVEMNYGYDALAKKLADVLRPLAARNTPSD